MVKLHPKHGKAVRAVLAGPTGLHGIELMALASLTEGRPVVGIHVGEAAYNGDIREGGKVNQTRVHPNDTGRISYNGQALREGCLIDKVDAPIGWEPIKYNWVLAVLALASEEHYPVILGLTVLNYFTKDLRRHFS